MLCGTVLLKLLDFLANTVRESLQIVAANVGRDYQLSGSGGHLQSTRPPNGWLSARPPGQ